LKAGVGTPLHIMFALHTGKLSPNWHKRAKLAHNLSDLDEHSAVSIVTPGG